ncbi:hypothetical protein FGKAn22_23910 [Ferrigenium kumadai]|uniref:DUF2141 domain-containing protein n=1 Tax=Ferrigenium kumadai TaxID=1682490 RepID=A0AAN1W0P9_9PROT|nr:DUF2141 domain-containing protein [Ferrigenium kumadai]BBJ00699.1 hypothetical protein FGKAn22_23910 [Ferrigenium kumadai]
MKRLAILAMLLIATYTQAGELKLELYGQGLAGSQIRVAVYSANAPEQFPRGEKFYRGTASEASSDRLIVLLPDLPSGRYAVAVYADNNRNGRLDRNFLGVPTEIYGFSNNARGRFGPPGFAEAAFELGDGTVAQSIHLK